MEPFTQEASFQRLAANLPGVLYQLRWFTDGTIAFAFLSLRCQPLLAVQPEAIQQDVNQFLEHLHPADRDSFTASIAQSAQTLEPWHWEGKFFLSDKQFCWLQTSADPVQLGEAIVWDGLLLDVTAAKHAQISYQQREAQLQEARQSEQKFRSLFEQTADACLILDGDVFIDCNQATLDMMRCQTKVQMLSLHPAVLSPEVQPDGRSSMEKANAMIAIALQQGNHRFEWMHRRVDGEDFPVEVLLTKIPLAGKQVLYTVWRDISDRQQIEHERQQTQAALQASEERHRCLVSATAQSVWLADAAGQVKDVPLTLNTALRPGAGVGMGWLNTLHPDDREPTLQAWMQAVESKIRYEAEFRIQMQDGRYRYFVSRAVPLLEANGNIREWIGTLTDIDDRKQAESALQEREQFLRTLYDGVEHAIFVVDVLDDGDLRYVEQNAFAEKITGVQSIEIVGKTPEAIYGQAYGSFIRQRLNLCLESGTAILIEEPLLFQGQECWWMTTMNPLRAPTGRIYRIVGTAFDISDRKRVEDERKQAEQELRESLSLYESLADALPQCLFRIDRNHRLIFGNAAFLASLNLSRQELPGKSLYQFYPEELATKYKADNDRVMQSGEILDLIEEHEAPATGERIHVQVVKVPIRNHDNQIVGLQGIFWDITDRRRAEQALRESEERFRLLISCVQDYAILMLDPQGFVASWNAGAEAIKGYQAEEIIGRHFSRFYSAEDQAQAKPAQDLAIAATAGRLEDEGWRVRKDGSRFWANGILTVLRDESGEIRGFSKVTRDVTERKQAQAILEQALQRAEYQFDLLQNVINSSLDWIAAKDHNFRYILSNASHAKALGYTPNLVLGKDELELGLPPEQVLGNPEKNIVGFRVDDQKALNGQIVHNPCEPVTLADGSLQWVETQKVPLRDRHGEIFGVLAMCRDVTARQKAEEALRQSEAQLRQKAIDLEQTLQELQHTQMQLVQSEKMSSLGQLVAGVAHEINNPVNFISGNLNHASHYIQVLLRLLHLYQTYYPQPQAQIQTEAEAIDLEFLIDDLPKLLASMRVGTERIQKIVLSLRNFSRMDEAEVKAVDIHEGIDSTLMILQNRLKEKPDQPGIQLVKNYGSLPPVECYAGQLNQVFMNILTNAIDAIEEQNHQCIKAGIKENFFQEPSQISITTDVKLNWVQIRIADTGIGITEAAQKRLFDPFFTTKPVGKGTGLGMSISYQIVTEKHGGSLRCHSIVGQGTEFVIEIPIQRP